MNATKEVAVTLSSELLDHLRAESRLIGVPLEYLVAGLVVDTMGDQAESPVRALAG